MDRLQKFRDVAYDADYYGRYLTDDVYERAYDLYQEAVNMMSNPRLADGVDIDAKIAACQAIIDAYHQKEAEDAERYHDETEDSVSAFIVRAMTDGHYEFD